MWLCNEIVHLACWLWDEVDSVYNFFGLGMWHIINGQIKLVAFGLGQIKSTCNSTERVMYQQDDKTCTMLKIERYMLCFL